MWGHKMTTISGSGALRGLTAHRGFAAVLAERLRLSDLTLKESRGYAARGRASRKAKRIDGKPEAFRKDSGKAATR